MKFYITTSIPYTNGDPHIGFAMELMQADALARYHRLKLDATYFLAGADQNGLKNYQTALKENLTTLEYVNARGDEFLRLAEVDNISKDDFIRTTDQQRLWPGAQKLWQI